MLRIARNGTEAAIGAHRRSSPSSLPDRSPVRWPFGMWSLAPFLVPVVEGTAGMPSGHPGGGADPDETRATRWVRVDDQADIASGRIDGRADHAEQPGPFRAGDPLTGSDAIRQTIHSRRRSEEGEVKRPTGEEHR